MQNSNFANLHIFNLIDVNDFEVWMCKIELFFYFALSYENALRERVGRVIIFFFFFLKRKDSEF